MPLTPETTMLARAIHIGSPRPGMAVPAAVAGPTAAAVAAPVLQAVPSQPPPEAPPGQIMPGMHAG
eukprot:15440487-Alexandrium_andersonii.AAC.1